MKRGFNIEYEGRNYDILELPVDAFLHLLPGLSQQGMKRLDEYFEDIWPEQTVRRHHILEFAAEQLGSSVDRLLASHEKIQFDDEDVAAYIEYHTKHGNRPS